MIVSERRHIFTPPMADVELVAEYVYCALVCLSDESGSLVAPDQRLDPGTLLGVSSVTRVHGARPILKGVSAILAGIAPEQYETPDGSWLWLFAWNEAQSQLEPVECEVNIPGYVPVKVDLAFPRLTESITVHKIKVSRGPGSMGEFVLEFSPETSRGLVEGSPGGILNLVSEDGRQLRYRVESLPQRSQSFKLPHGQYSCRFVASVGTFEYPPAEKPSTWVVIGDEAGIFRVPVRSTGSIELLLEPDERAVWSCRITCLIGNPPTSEPASGPSDLRFGPGDGDRSDSAVARTTGKGLSVGYGDTVWLNGPPFVIRGLLADVYSVFVLDPASNQQVPDLVDVQGGVTARLHVSIK